MKIAFLIMPNLMLLHLISLLISVQQIFIMVAALLVVVDKAVDRDERCPILMVANPSSPTMEPSKPTCNDLLVKSVISMDMLQSNAGTCLITPISLNLQLISLLIPLLQVPSLLITLLQVHSQITSTNLTLWQPTTSPTSCLT